MWLTSVILLPFPKPSGGVSCQYPFIRGLGGRSRWLGLHLFDPLCFAPLPGDVFFFNVPGRFKVPCVCWPTAKYGGRCTKCQYPVQTNLGTNPTNFLLYKEAQSFRGLNQAPGLSPHFLNRAGRHQGRNRPNLPHTIVIVVIAVSFCTNYTTRH